MPKRFSRINFHTETVERFKKYALANDTNYTETLEVLLDFFEQNSINPFEPFDDSKQRLETLINKRMDGVEAILRRIETEQTKPTKMLLDQLFNQQDEKQPKFVEKRKNAF